LHNAPKLKVNVYAEGTRLAKLNAFDSKQIIY